MEMVVRVFIIYFFIVAGLRLLGKREFGQLSPLELVTLLLIPEIVSQALAHNDSSLTNAIIGVATLFALVFVTSLIAYKSPKFESFIAGKPVLLLHDGKFLTDNMDKERISPEEIFTEMRKAGIADVSEVHFIILEPDGKLAVIKNQPESDIHRQSSNVVTK